MNTTNELIGREVYIGTKYGIGKIVGFSNEFPHKYVEVFAYHVGYSMKFDPYNVHLIDWIEA